MGAVAGARHELRDPPVPGVAGAHPGRRDPDLCRAARRLLAPPLHRTRWLRTAGARRSGVTGACGRTVRCTHTWNIQRRTAAKNGRAESRCHRRTPFLMSPGQAPAPMSHKATFGNLWRRCQCLRRCVCVAVMSRMLSMVVAIMTATRMLVMMDAADVSVNNQSYAIRTQRRRSAMCAREE